jgi:hypothetical protein
VPRGACHLVRLDRRDDFPFNGPLLSLDVLELRLSVVELLRAQMDDRAAAAALELREGQIRVALEACRALRFGIAMRRALSTKVALLEEDALAALHLSDVRH